MDWAVIKDLAALVRKTLILILDELIHLDMESGQKFEENTNFHEVLRNRYGGFGYDLDAKT